LDNLIAYATNQDSGICIHGSADALALHVSEYTQALGISDVIEFVFGPEFLQFKLRQDVAMAWMPAHNTTALPHFQCLGAGGPYTDLEREIVIAMIGAPVTFIYPNFAEFHSSVRIRRNIAIAARKTQLAFHTTDLERPKNYWNYHEDTGFTILPGRSLTEALKMATQPEESANLYSFSCYRATEYVMLLGIAQELELTNPTLLLKLQDRCTHKAIKSAEFHETFLHEYGSMNEPLPGNYYVPGDRLWLRNPDAHSSDVSGYEGSWLIYLGGGQFSNFWSRDSPYTLGRKCAEMFHWRNATYLDAHGELRIDEAIVSQLTDKTMANTQELEEIIAKMARLRDPSGVYGNGGMLDASREFSRWIGTETCDIHFLNDAVSDSHGV
jgi:hypothetical protein